MASDLAGLRLTMEKLARTTWTDITDGRRLGVGMGEVSITDRNMLALRREHPELIVHKHPVNEEVRTGADWEWWVCTSGGWLNLVFQAKVLDATGRYPGITKGLIDSKSQADVLLRTCLLRSERFGGAVWPLYCFYNSWHGGWPAHVPRFDGASQQTMSGEELHLYGCAVAGAWSVRHVLAHHSYAQRRTLRDSYLSFSRPWSTIFPDTGESARYQPEQTMAILSSMTDPSHKPAQLPAGGVASRKWLEPEFDEPRRRDRKVVYRHPALIGRAPDYVLDLLEDKMRNRRLKPVARRVVILPEPI